MPARYTEKRERREPEKTPLIDVIFLLLIFFFVTVVGLDVTPKPTYGPKSGGSQKKLDLLPMVKPMEPAPDSLKKALLIQVLPATEIDETLIDEMNYFIGLINNMSDQPFGRLKEVSRSDFLFFLFDEKYSDVRELSKMLTDLRNTLKKYDLTLAGTLKNEVNNILTYFPVNLPRKGNIDFENLYKAAIGTVTARLSDTKYFARPRAREIHIRMHKTVYVKLIGDLFSICNDPKLDVRNIKFRVIEQKDV